MIDKRYTKEEVKPIMLITFNGRMSDKALSTFKDVFKDSDIDSLYTVIVLEEQDRAEVRIITYHIDGNTNEPSHKIPTVDKDRIERFDKPNTPSYDKVMEAIERAEERIRTNSKHILTLQQEVNTLLDDKIDGSWFSKGVVRLDDKERAKLKKEFEDMYTVSTWWSRLMNRNN